VTEPGRPGLAGFPANLLLHGRRVLVVGAGRIAARKTEGILEVGGDVHVVAPRVGDEIRALADAGRLTVSEREFTGTDLDDAWLAFAATDDPEVNASVHDAGEARRVWVNAADDPGNCSFTLMSKVRRGDIVVSIGTGGRSPALATWLKERVESELGPEYMTLLEILSEAREEIRAGGGSSEDADWRSAFDSGILDLVRSDRLDEAKELLRSCL